MTMPCFSISWSSGKLARQAVRDCEQALALRREIGTRRVSAAHDRCQTVKRGIVDVVGVDDRIKRASIADVPEFNALDVVGGASDIGGDLGHFGRRARR